VLYAPDFRCSQSAWIPWRVSSSELATFASWLLSEPVSPEIVLVDPEIAERERARLRENARLAEFRAGEDERLRAEARDISGIDVAALRRAVERDGDLRDDADFPVVRRDVHAFARRKLLPAVLMCSLFVNGILASELVVRTDSQHAAPHVAAEHLTSAGPVTSAGLTSTRLEPLSRAAVRSRLSRRSVAEQKLISLIITAPARKLPRQFVDPASGLVRNNVRVVCKRSHHSTFLCRVSLPGGPPGAGLLVRYRPGPHGEERYTWYGYRRAAGVLRSTPNS
jgi:hypothetical protein